MPPRRYTRPEIEPADSGYVFLDPHPDLQYPRGTIPRARLWRMFTRTIRPTRSIDWDVLDLIGDQGRAVAMIGAEDSTPFRRMFDLGSRRSFRELTLEFLSTFTFTPPPRGAAAAASGIDRTTHIAVVFYLGGHLFEYTLAGWAVLTGFYTSEETEDPRFYTDEIESETQPLVAFWPQLSDAPVANILRSTSFRDPLMRYLQRAIAGMLLFNFCKVYKYNFWYY